MLITNIKTNFQKNFPIYLLAGIFLIKALILGFFITPLWDTPDETGHFAYARDIGLGKKIPLLGDGLIDNDILTSAYNTHIENPSINWIAQHPPIYYFITGAVWKIASLFTSNLEFLFKITRIVAAFFGSMTLIVLFKILKLFKLKTISNLSIIASISFIPMYSHLSSGTNHDTTVTFFSSLAIFYWTKYILDKKTTDSYLSAFWLSIAAFTKMTVLVFLVPMLTVLILEFKHDKNKIKKIVKTVLISIIFPTLWMLRHYLAFGKPLATASILTDQSNLIPKDISFFEYLKKEPVLIHFFRNFFGWFGWVGTGKGSFSVLQVKGNYILIYIIIALLIFITSFIILFKQIEKNSQLINSQVYQKLLIQEKLSIYYKKILFNKIIIWFWLLLSLFITYLFFKNLWIASGLEYILLRVVFSTILLFFLLAPLVLIFKFKKLIKISLYSLGILFFYSTVLLFEIYKLNLYDVGVRATHGRYFYPVFAFFLLATVLPLKKLINKKPLIVVVFAIAMLINEIIIYRNLVIPFYFN